MNYWAQNTSQHLGVAVPLKGHKVQFMQSTTRKTEAQI